MAAVGVLKEGALQKKAKGKFGITFYHPRYFVLTAPAPPDHAQALLYYQTKEQRGGVPIGIIPLSEVQSVEEVHFTKNKKHADRRIDVTVANETEETVFSLLAESEMEAAAWAKTLNDAVLSSRQDKPETEVAMRVKMHAPQRTDSFQIILDDRDDHKMKRSSTQTWKASTNTVERERWSNLRLIPHGIKRSQSSPNTAEPHARVNRVASVPNIPSAGTEPQPGADQSDEPAEQPYAAVDGDEPFHDKDPDDGVHHETLALSSDAVIDSEGPRKPSSPASRLPPRKSISSEPVTEAEASHIRMNKLRSHSQMLIHMQLETEERTSRVATPSSANQPPANSPRTKPPSRSVTLSDPTPQSRRRSDQPAQNEEKSSCCCCM